MKLLREFWESQHIGQKTIDLRSGYFDRNKLKYYSYSSLFPNLVILGAQKCGTSSLAHYLSFHPDIHVSMPLKEPGFYLFEEWAKGYWENHEKFYKCSKELLRQGMLKGYSGQRYFLDATTRYTLGTSSKDFDLPDKLKPAVEKCIYIVRNPFSRMISSYNHFYKGRVSEGFDERFLVDSSILETSLYYKQLSAYSKVLGAENILVLVFEEFVQDIQSSLRQVYNFLNLQCILPYSKFPVMNVTRNKTEYFYSAENFKQLNSSVSPDVHELEAYLGRSLNWDLSAATWVRAK